MACDKYDMEIESLAFVLTTYPILIGEVHLGLLLSIFQNVQK